MNRFLFTLKNLCKHRQALREVLENPAKFCATVLDITPAKLSAAGIEVLVLDFDGVLSAHAAPTPRQDVITWLEDLAKSWPYFIFIFSNNPSVERENFFKEHFPRIQFIKKMARKPYPDGLLDIEAQTKVPAHKILMVDDRLLTGILAAILAGTQGLLVRTPYQDFKHHFFKETLFSLFRIMDKILLFKI